MQISTDDIKQLREKTGAGVIDCKNALSEACGDFSKACEILNERGVSIAKKKSERAANSGLVETYVHLGGKIGVLLELNCETDFVAKTDEFKTLAHDLALQIAAMSPLYIKADEVPQDSTESPETVCLLLQPFIKDAAKNIQDLITEAIAKVGENIKLRRFVRFELGC
ncbi:MAG TPA: translation elongation factor Ts [Dehalococcoidia bacterium]|nr:translation elongation factor Ts [Dehalococcoidia bacterium]